MTSDDPLLKFQSEEEEGHDRTSGKMRTRYCNIGNVVKSLLNVVLEDVRCEVWTVWLCLLAYLFSCSFLSLSMFHYLYLKYKTQQSKMASEKVGAATVSYPGLVIV